jgi:16S rRNA (adenine1518-N6/adenine1519-N6)-dimethyltransferase
VSNFHTPRKRFGQNFLIDQNIIDDILDHINPQAGQHIVEIGPGQGALTESLIDSGAHIYAIEIDRDLAKLLEQNYSKHKNFKLHCADVLKFELNDLIKSHTKLRIVGNLPYNISSPLLFKLFNSIDIVEDMFFMLQREVALRLSAYPNSKEYGRMSIMAQYYCDMHIVVDVPSTAFDPAPKVESCVVQFIPHAKPKVAVKDHKLFQHIVTEAFSHRRKTISNALKKYITPDQLQQLDIDPQLRAENLTIEQYANITNYVGTLTAAAE